MSALHDPRANALGLGGLQEAARQSFELLQQALGHHMPPSPAPGLLDPLLRGSDLPQGPGSGLPHQPGGGFFGGQGSLAGTPHQPGAPHGDPRMGTPASTRQVEREEVKPTVLEPFRTPQGPLATVNPFWTTSIQQELGLPMEVQDLEMLRNFVPRSSKRRRRSSLVKSNA